MIFKKLIPVMLLLCISTQLMAQKTRAGIPVKIALQAYSFSKLLNDNAKGRGAGMSLPDLLDFSAENNFDAVDLTGYFFPGYPNVPSDEYINNVKRKAFQLGLDICGTGVKNDFANPDPEKRAADVKHVKEWIDVAVKLGAPVIRIFSGNIPEGYEKRWDEIARYMAASIKECADYGKKRGVMVGVQNHGDFLKTGDETIRLVKMVNSEWFGVIVDSGYFLTEDPYADMAKVMPYAVNFLLKESPIPGGSDVRIDLPKVMKILKDSKYIGYLPIETLSAKGPGKEGNKSAVKKPAYDPYQVVPVFLKEVKAAVKEAYKN
ncbi:sugar phosphate isomerase/epimerase family protein [Pedobacter heparinus]|uniref:Xylose isomerase domain protein TIM barrel n=1 Tax=Pedobacter heparinus (strain ATCC 13125 / DSM 2366 / CIP 104194 / JCM 7457 / NBRC 12017 / NCIMB 9290 / NRRL B-14731 / HIM 762-3) TaxID=485917 RepID=C6Y326_PEDHD|nr:sugar phosphate isomerase/epimerase family protein [Pedobacter heparinus]ACU03239.1 Xylose isomerase domain protein TIM barrel [Pedobacter heparinus DSM 2366]